MTNNKKILIIDDSEEDREICKRFLQGKVCSLGNSYQITEAATGGEGKILFENELPHCVLLDLSLPDTDGIQLLNQLVSKAPGEQLCVIMLTGSGNETVAVKAIHSGASDYLVKGKFTAEGLCHAVENALEKTQYRMQLAQARVDVEQFAYAAAHDLQEPLRTLAGFAGLLRSRHADQLDGKALTYIDYMVDATERMSTLIRNLLDYSLAGRQDAANQPVDMHRVLTQVRENIRTKMDETGAQLQYNSLPVVAVNEWQMVQVFQNLISNAIKFRSDRPLVITIAAEEQPDHWQFSVSDTGIGMDMQYAKKIFQPFQRLHTRHEYEGTGIGLATCKKIVERHGGTIWVESEKDKGSTFYFTVAKTG